MNGISVNLKATLSVEDLKTYFEAWFELCGEEKPNVKECDLREYLTEEEYFDNTDIYYKYALYFIRTGEFPYFDEDGNEEVLEMNELSRKFKFALEREIEKSIEKFVDWTI